MLGWFLPHNNVNQPQSYMPSLWASPHPIPPGHHSTRLLPVLHSNVSSAIHLTPDSVSMLMLLVLLSPSPSWPQVHSLHLHIFKCVSLSTLPPRLETQNSATHLSFSHLSSSEVYQFSLLKGSHSVTFFLSSAVALIQALVIFLLQLLLLSFASIHPLAPPPLLC